MTGHDQHSIIPIDYRRLTLQHHCWPLIAPKVREMDTPRSKKAEPWQGNLGFFLVTPNVTQLILIFGSQSICLLILTKYQRS